MIFCSGLHRFSWSCGLRTSASSAGGSAAAKTTRSGFRSPARTGKKTPSLVLCPKHCGARSNSQGDGPLCTGGVGVRGFSWSAVRRSFYLSNNTVGAVLPPQVNFFLISCICLNIACFVAQVHLPYIPPHIVHIACIWKSHCITSYVYIAVYTGRSIESTWTKTHTPSTDQNNTPNMKILAIKTSDQLI